MSEPDDRIFDWRLVKVGEVAPLKGGHGSWVETDHPAVIASMGSAPECAAHGCQAERIADEWTRIAAQNAADAKVREASLQARVQALEAKNARLRAAIDEHNTAWEVLSKDNHNDDLWDRYDASRNALLALTEPRREEERE